MRKKHYKRKKQISKNIRKTLRNNIKLKGGGVCTRNSSNNIIKITINFIDFINFLQGTTLTNNKEIELQYSVDLTRYNKVIYNNNHIYDKYRDKQINSLEEDKKNVKRVTEHICKSDTELPELDIDDIDYEDQQKTLEEYIDKIIEIISNKQSQQSADIINISENKILENNKELENQLIIYRGYFQKKINKCTYIKMLLIQNIHALVIKVLSKIKLSSLYENYVAQHITDKNNLIFRINTEPINYTNAEEIKKIDYYTEFKYGLTNTNTFTHLKYIKTNIKGKLYFDDVDKSKITFTIIIPKD